MIQTPQQLKGVCRLDTLLPFGLKITAKEAIPLSELAPLFLEKMARHEKIVLLRGFEPPTRELFLSYCESIPGKRPLHWETGPVMEMKEDPNAKNYLFTSEAVPFHWDGAFHQVPQYLLFQCLQTPGASFGGETLFSNTEMMWQAADESTRESWSKLKLIYRTEKLAHYGGEVQTKMVDSHPYTGQTILRFAERVETKLNPVSIDISGIPDAEVDSFLSKVKAMIYSADFCYAHSWERGDIIIADNYSLIHGRTQYLKGAPRHLRRIQLIEEKQHALA